MPDGLHKEASIPIVWKHAVKQSQGEAGGSQNGLDNSQLARPLLSEDQAALRIGRRWRMRCAGRTALSRTRLIERLQLESSVRVGIIRMMLFLCVFFFNLLLTYVDVSPAYKLEIRNNIRTTLNLEAFDGIRTLEELRDFIPQLGSRIKTFGASRNTRYLDRHSFRLLNDRTTFTSPMSLFTPFKIDGAEFTLTAWVEVLPSVDPSAVERIPLLRKPMQTDNSLTCWGWFHAPEFRFGAHDFHSLNAKELEASVSSGLKLETGLLTHEVLVSKGGVFTFFRNGVKVASIPTPRSVTECDGDVVLLGSPLIALASVSFYARALQDNEVAEMYVGGQPLSELATGSLLPQVDIEPADQIMEKVRSSSEVTGGSLRQTNSRTLYNTVLSISQFKEAKLTAAENEILFPADGAGVTVLGNPANEAGLPDRAKLLKIQGLLAPKSYEEARQASRSLRSDSSGKTYFPAIVGPILNDAHTTLLSHHFYLTIPQSSAGLTINFWVQWLRPDWSDGSILTLYGGGCGNCVRFSNCTDQCLSILNFDMGAWMQWGLQQMGPGSATGLAQIGEFGGLWSEDDSEQRAPDEKFLNTRRASFPGPSTWRMVTAVVGKGVNFYKDGKLVGKSTLGSTTNDPRDIRSDLSDLDMSLFSDGWVELTKHQSDYSPDITASARVADVRIYPEVLTDGEIQKIHKDSVWPNGNKMKQCAEMADADFFDSEQVDEGGRDCLWYASNVKKDPSICASIAAKKLCPVTCRGRRMCHDGSLFKAYVPPPKKAVYRVFDRVMWLKPRHKSKPIICPSRNVERSSLLAKCRKEFLDAGCASCATGNAVACGPETGCKCYNGNNEDGRCADEKWQAVNAPTSGTSWRSKSLWNEFYGSHAYSNMWKNFSRTDLWDCDAVEKDLDERQCSWDPAWIQPFKLDVKETKFYSVTIWMKPTDNSYGMPRFFFPYIRLTSRLSRPFTIATIGEKIPIKEDQLDFLDWRFGRQFIRFTGNVDYKDWTMLYLSWEFDGSRWTKCMTVNNKAQKCYCPKPCCHPPIPEQSCPDNAPPLDIDENAESPIDALPENFLEAVEANTEVLLAPLEFTAQRQSRSELQAYYYKRKAELEKIQGPSKSEQDRVETFDSMTTKEVGSFDEKLGLVAPPLLFQTRLQISSCNKAVGDPFLAAQLALVNSSHCTVPGMCQGVSSAKHMMQCVDTEESLESYFALNTTTLNGEKGFSDYLFTYSDNPIVVRGGMTLPTRNFFDSKTLEGKVVASFVSPENGLLVVLELIATFDGGALSTDSSFQMLSFMPQDLQGQAVAFSVGLFMALGMVMVLSCIQILTVIQAAREGDEYNTWDVVEVVFDVGQVIMIVYYGITVLGVVLNAEVRSGELVGGLVQVPFVAPDITPDKKFSDFFKAMDQVFEELQTKENLGSFGFAIMILNLIKVLQTTRAHPRVGVLVATVIKGLDDIFHFGILFLIVFITFAMTGTWAFGKEREEFATFQTGMTTQFAMLNGEFPEGFEDDNKMISYVVLTYVVQFLLMLNFMLAIVVDSYAKVKEELETQETQSDILSDIYVSSLNSLRGLIHRWPSGLSKKLQGRLVTEKVSYLHLATALGISSKTARSIIEAYHNIDAIRFEQNPPDACDELLLKRASKMLGVVEAQGLVGADVNHMQRAEQERKLESEIAGLEHRLAQNFSAEIRNLQAQLPAHIMDLDQSKSSQPHLFLPPREQPDGGSGEATTAPTAPTTRTAAGSSPEVQSPAPVTASSASEPFSFPFADVVFWAQSDRQGK